MKKSGSVLTVCLILLFALTCGVCLSENIGNAIELNPDAPANAFSAIDLNHTDAETLMKIPGIGEQLASNIIAYRQANGGFQSVAELLNVDGIGQVLFNKIQPYITIGGTK